MRFKQIFLLILCVPALWSHDREPLPPYITGDGFRDYADHLYDETSKEMSPAQVLAGSTVFVKADLICEFAKKIHPQITHPYILITHNADQRIPGAYSFLLDDPKIIAWFGQNVTNYCHEKLHPIPIGLENRYNRGKTAEVIASFVKFPRNITPSVLLYLNVNLATNPVERGMVIEKFKDKPYCHHANKRLFLEYLNDILRSKFILSPEGTGLDCHRTWETLYLKRIPIVKHSSSDALFEDLPVYLIDSWDEISPEKLEEVYLKTSDKAWNYEKLTLDYWLHAIERVKKNFLEASNECVNY